MFEKKILLKRDQSILIVGAGPNQVQVIAKAMEMGLRTVAADGDPNAVGLAKADVGVVVNITDGAALAEAARLHAVDGIWPGAEAGVVATAEACTALGLPGVAPEVARCLRDKAAMREALAAGGAGLVPFRRAESREEAEAAASAMGLPVIVKPADGNASKGVQQVEHIEDVSLAFAKAAARSASGAVIVETFVEGAEFNVDGLVYEGQFTLGGITGKDVSPLPFRYDMGIWMPPMLPPETEEAIVHAVDEALVAIGYHTGTVHAEVIVGPEGARIVEIAGRPGGGRIPTDLIPRSYGWDYTADSLRIALGEAPIGARVTSRGTAVYWVQAPSGVVADIIGVENARAMDGIFDVVMTVREGDTLGHIIDCATRDAIGYVMAEAETPQDTVAIAKAARDAITVVTNPVL